MSALFDIVQLLLFAYAGGALLYVFVLTMLAVIFRKRTDFATRKKRRFAILIPAHNEEGGIASTVEAIGKIDYPANLFRTIVIADNCTDGTAAAARRAGAEVLERSDAELRGKGFALRWAIDRLAQEGAPEEALVIIDADSEPSTNFLQVLNWHLEDGAAAIQTTDIVAPRNRGWSARMTRIGFLLYNYVRPLGRMKVGGNVGLRGNGMCFRRDLFERIPWNAFTIGEDLEFGLHLLLKGVKVRFAPEGVVHALMPEEARNAVSQRARWEGSRFGLIRRYAVPLLWNSISRGSIASLDALFDLITPAMVNLIGFTLIMGFLSGIVAAAGWGTILWVGLWALAFFFGFFHLFAGLWIAGADRETYMSILSIPRYAFWKLMVYAGMGRQKEAEWVRTTRE